MYQHWDSSPIAAERFFHRQIIYVNTARRRAENCITCLYRTVLEVNYLVRPKLFISKILQTDL